MVFEPVDWVATGVEVVRDLASGNLAGAALNAFLAVAPGLGGWMDDAAGAAFRAADDLSPWPTQRLQTEDVLANQKALGGGSDPQLWSVDPSMRERDIYDKTIVDNAYKVNDTRVQLNADLINPHSGNVMDPSSPTGSGINGNRMYVIDAEGNIWIGIRGDDRMPTLIGGENPQVLAAGMIEFRAGRIYRVDNASGHFKPGEGSLDVAEEVFSTLPASAFHRDFQGYRPYDE